MKKYLIGNSNLSVTNLADTKYIASISAEGLKVGNGRSIMSGLEYNF